MEVYFLLASVVTIICVMFQNVSSKFGIPTLFVFIILGMLFGSDGIFKINFHDFAFAEQICSAALIIIMFSGGFGTNWSEAKPVVVKSFILATVGVAFTAGLVGFFCYFALNIGLIESMLIGSVISSTDAASVFSILRSKKLGLKYNTDSMLEVESGSNDPCSYMLTVITLSFMASKISVGGVIYMTFAQFFYGAVMGILLGFLAAFILRHVKMGDGFDMVFVIGMAMMSFALPSAMGGNGYLSAYIVGIILGNANIKDKPSLVHFFNGITGLAQMVIFFLLGLVAFPSQIPSVFFTAFLIFLFLTFAARPIAIFSLLTPARCSIPQQLLVSFAGIRGAASIVFAVMVTVSDAFIENDVFHITFCMVLLSIAFQGSLLPWASRRLRMTDPNINVLKTFNDYTEEVDIQFIKLVLNENHPWINKTIMEITLPPDMLIVVVLRGESRRVIPCGATVLLKGDVCVLSAPAFQDDNNMKLSEHKIARDSKWKGKKIYEFSPSPNELVVMIKRDGKSVIPRGDTVINEGDVLVINQIG